MDLSKPISRLCQTRLQSANCRASAIEWIQTECQNINIRRSELPLHVNSTEEPIDGVPVPPVRQMDHGLDGGRGCAHTRCSRVK